VKTVFETLWFPVFVTLTSYITWKTEMRVTIGQKKTLIDFQQPRFGNLQGDKL